MHHRGGNLRIGLCWVVLFFALVSVTSTLRAQTNEIEYLHHMWRTEDGLPGPTVKAILQDRTGYLYVATDEGLARFDGVRFHNMEPPVPANRAERWLVALTETKDGSLWASSVHGGLSRFKDGEVTR